MFGPPLKHGIRYPVDSPQAEAARQRLERLAADPAERAKAAENDRLAR
jgi:hypothetical protein